MINRRISAVWSTTKPITPFSCTPRLQEVHTKSDVVHLTLVSICLVVLQTAEILGLIICFAIHFLCVTFE